MDEHEICRICQDTVQRIHGQTLQFGCIRGEGVILLCHTPTDLTDSYRYNIILTLEKYAEHSGTKLGFVRFL